MLGELPPVVALPLNPTDFLIPVQVFVQSAGLYSTQCASHHDETPPKDADSANRRAKTLAVSCQIDTGELQPHNSSNKGVAPLLPLGITRSSTCGETETLKTSSERKMAMLVTKDVDVLLEVLEQRYGKYTSMKRVKTEWYLNRIEVEVDRFLVSHYSRKSSLLGSGVAFFIRSTLTSTIQSEQREVGTDGMGESIHGASVNDGDLPKLQESFYTENAIPFNYLDVRPANMGAIVGNLVVLRHCLAECVTPGSTVARLLLEPIVRSVWERALTPLEGSAKGLLVVAEENVRPPLEHVLRQQSHGKAAEWTERLAKYDHIVKALRDDLNYLETIHEMDREAVSNVLRGAGEKMSHYVPVSGLVLSRLHRLENEHRTVWEFWRTR